MFPEPSTVCPSTPTPPRQSTSPQVAINDIGSEEDFLAAIDETIKYFNDGDIVEGTIVKVDRDEVLLDIGYKTEGVIPSRELSIKHDVDPNEVVAVGDEVEALVLQKEDKEGRLILSKKRAQYERAWGTIEQLKDNDEPVKGTVIEVVKGGLILDIGLRGFLPASLVEMRRVRDLQPYVGKEIEAKIIELDKNRNNVVLSRRAWLEQTQSAVRSEFLNQLAKGQIRSGQVSSIVNFGAFVDLGGVDGLVHVSELSWKHIDHPSEVVEVGQEVKVEVLDVDLDRERVSLSLKATQEDPWRQFARTHQIGQIVPGKVTKLVPFGAFVRVDEGIEGLVHISELAERHVEVPEQVVQVGNDVMVKVIDIDLDRRRISLSLKQANEGMTTETEFDPALYGMAAEYDDAGNYIYPEGFDPDSGDWREGYDTQREEWERQYAAAYARYEQHIAQLQRTQEQEAEAAEAAPANYSSGGPSSEGGGRRGGARRPRRRRLGPGPGPAVARAAAARSPATPSSPRCARSSPAADRPGTARPRALTPRGVGARRRSRGRRAVQRTGSSLLLGARSPRSRREVRTDVARSEGHPERRRARRGAPSLRQATAARGAGRGCGALDGGAQVPGAGEQALDEAAAGDLGHREGGRDLGDGPARDQAGVAEAMTARSAARTEHGGDSPRRVVLVRRHRSAVTAGTRVTRRSVSTPGRVTPTPARADCGGAEAGAHGWDRGGEVDGRGDADRTGRGGDRRRRDRP